MSSIKTIGDQRIEAIEYLLNRDYPKLDQAKLISPTDEDFKEAQVYIAMADRDRTNLRTWSIYELKNGVVQEKIKEADEEREEFLKSKAGIKNLTHNQPSSKVNIGLWGKMATWDSLEEGSLLCQNIDPEDCKWKDGIEPFIKYCPRARKVSENRRLISRAIEAGDLLAREKPPTFIAWAKQKNIDYPPELGEEIKRYEGDIVDSKSIYKEKCAEVTRLEGELVSCKEDLEQIKSKEKPFNTKERESMLKIIIGTAVRGYGYQPKELKSPIPKQITDDLVSQGISLDVDTVRKYLREAQEFLPSQDTGKN
jgi:hypothetical protein